MAAQMAAAPSSRSRTGCQAIRVPKDDQTISAPNRQHSPAKRAMSRRKSFVSKAPCARLYWGPSLCEPSVPRRKSPNSFDRLESICRQPVVSDSHRIVQLVAS